MKGLVEFFIGGRHHIMTTLRFLYRGFERLIGLRRNEKTTLFVTPSAAEVVETYVYSMGIEGLRLRKLNSLQVELHI